MLFYGVGGVKFYFLVFCVVVNEVVVLLCVMLIVMLIIFELIFCRIKVGWVWLVILLSGVLVLFVLFSLMVGVDNWVLMKNLSVCVVVLFVLLVIMIVRVCFLLFIFVGQV